MQKSNYSNYNHNNYNQFLQYKYSTDLKKESNKVGLLVFLFFVLSTAFALAIEVVLQVISISTGASVSASSNTVIYLLESGLLSLLIFFAVSIIYCVARKLDLSKIIPFRKVNPTVLVLLCLSGLAVAMISNYASDSITAVMSWFGINNTISSGYQTDGVFEILLDFIVVSIVPAFVEEFVFRGVILGSLRKYSDGFAIITSSALFALMHGNFVQIPFAFVAALMFGYVVVKTNSLLPSIIIHFLNNALSVFASTIYDNKIFDETTCDIIYVTMLIVIALAGIVSTVILIKSKKYDIRIRKDDNIIPYRQKMKIFCSSPMIIVATVFLIIEAFSMIIASQAGLI